jgi:hypothetical protein
MQTTVTRWPSSDDLAFGPGATTVEKVISYLGGLALAGVVAWQYLTGSVDWTVWQWTLALVIALDLGAGAVANVLEPCARYYHAGPLPGDPWLVRQLKDPQVFAALHIYPLLVGLIFGPNDWRYGVGGYALMVIASLVVIRAVPRLQRPLAYLATVLVLAYGGLLLPAPAGFDWLLPVLFLKIVAGHSVTPGPPG